jgi:hypothetical protein
MKIIIFEAVTGKENARDSYKRGGGAEGVHEPRSWHYDLLCFLCDREFPRENFFNTKWKITWK